MKKFAYTKRAVAMLLCVIIAAAFLLAALFTSAHFHHDCTGNDCPVCMLVHHFSDMLRKLGIILMMFAASLFAAQNTLKSALMYHPFQYIEKNTPVSLKVQMNN